MSRQHARDDENELTLSEAGDRSTTFPYKALPRVEELKLARVAKLDFPRLVDPKIPDPLVGELTVEPGMYILVPEHFPDECYVFLSGTGYKAQASSRGVAIWQFRVWPAAHAHEAERLYRAASEKAESEPGLLPPNAIGSEWRPTSAGARRELSSGGLLLSLAGSTKP